MRGKLGEALISTYLNCKTVELSYINNQNSSCGEQKLYGLLIACDLAFLILLIDSMYAEREDVRILLCEMDQDQRSPDLKF